MKSHTQFNQYGILKKLSHTLLVIGFSALSSQAVTTVVSFDSGGQTLLNNNSVALSGGSAADGNGTVLELGYYTGASVANNFSGTWVALTGASGGNSAYGTTSIGDLNANGAGDGSFALTATFDPAAGAVSGTNLPVATTIPLAIMFYDATTVAGSSFYNVVSHDTWLWKIPSPAAPMPPTINISLDDAGLEWLGGAGSALKTTIATTVVPEPARVFLLGLGVVGLFWRRHRSC